MNRIIFALALTVLASPGMAQEGPLAPDPTLTPGKVASTDQAEVCGTDGGTYSQRHRVTPRSLKDAVARAYGQDHSDGTAEEIDHRLPLALGGADEAQNLWPQKWPGACGAHAKDRIEESLWRSVCKDGTMTLADAQAVFLGPYWKQLPGCVVP